MTDDPKIKGPRVWVAVTRKQKTCVLVGLRGPVCNNPNTWNLFGGNLDPGETHAEAAVRELLEETGISVDEEDLTPIFTKIVDGKPCTWFQVAGRKTDQTMAIVTPEVVDFDQANESWIGRDDLHYSLKEYLNWRFVESGF